MGRVPFEVKDVSKCRKGHDYKWLSSGLKRYCPTCDAERRAIRRARPGTKEIAARQMREWRAKNPEHVKALYNANRARNVARARTIKVERGCARCGERHPACLEFHHRDPQEKETNLAAVMGQWRWARMEKEIEKCDVLCTNCHRKLHWDEGTAYRKLVE